ncbi:hypothetical protein ACFSJW_21560 [Flavobacterium artemisiae]|uniref:Lipoprotein n=1 Tax=Flavobacterium artemisiae TaxID=2126556 RepID=A0ABW4HBF1_9FLAO
MKNQIKLTVILGIILTCFLFSCKKQDGYSDEVYNNPNSENAAAETPNDTASTTNSSAVTNDQTAGTQSTNNHSAGSGDANSGGEQSGPITGAESTAGNDETKGTGTGSGPGHSANDGASYTPSSDPKQNGNKDTIKKSIKRKK